MSFIKAGFSLAPASAILAPAAMAHTGHSADHSHFAANIGAWLTHVFTSPGHQLIGAAISLAFVGGLTAFHVIGARDSDQG